jgi:hypothetical protein
MSFTRFTEVFTMDKNKTPRHWSAREDIPALARAARLSAGMLLAQLAVVRLPSTISSDKIKFQKEEAANIAVEGAIMKLVQDDLQQQQDSETSSRMDKGKIDKRWWTFCAICMWQAY